MKGLGQLQGAALVWDESDTPRSKVYDDVYFSPHDGLGEARAVFLAGCRLPQAWADRTDFCVGELGFGTGLNIVALLDLWRHQRPPGARLNVFTIEAHPISAADATRALSRWPQVAHVSQYLTQRWPARVQGFQRIDLPGYDAAIDIWTGDAAAGLRAWAGAADAWFLDGFAPSRNPAMWNQEILNLVATRSAPRAHLASFTVAGQVRRDLQAAGFIVERVPGFGRKRQRLEAVLAGEQRVARPPPRVVIVGGGIAGASLARAFAAQGVSARVFESVAPGAGASGGPSALAAPRIDAGLGANAALFAQAFGRAVDLYDTTQDAVLSRGAELHRVGPKDASRFSAVASSNLFAAGAMELTDNGLAIKSAVVVEPRAVLAAWIGEWRQAFVDKLDYRDAEWSLLDDQGGVIATADVVCLAAGMGCASLAAGLPLDPVRGQASVAQGLDWPGASLFGAYVLPTREGLLFGATHDRGDSDDRPRAADHQRNLAAIGAVLPGLALELAGRSLVAWTGIRATTRDYLPLAGAVPAEMPGLYVLGGLGSRGFTLAPLLAEHIAASALSRPSPLPRHLAELVDPARFERRAMRRISGKAQVAGEAGSGG